MPHVNAFSDGQWFGRVAERMSVDGVEYGPTLQPAMFEAGIEASRSVVELCAAKSAQALRNLWADGQSRRMVEEARSAGVRARTCKRRLVRHQRARRSLGGQRRLRSRLFVRGRRRLLRGARSQSARTLAGPNERALPRRVQPGGFPRPRRRLPAPHRRRRAAASTMGFRSLPAEHRAYLRSDGRRALRRLHGGREGRRLA
jgi:hypothetical protein